MRTHVLSTLFGTLLFFTSFAQTSPIPYVGCPNGNMAVVRAGDNSGILNPMSIYTIATTTGTPTLLSGPIKDPTNPLLNLQVNGVGLNSVDGYLYGLYAGVPSINFTLPFKPALAFYRIGVNGIAVEVGTIAGPNPPESSPANASVVNPAAGEFDQFGNYYFTAVSGIVHPNHTDPLASTFKITNLFIGKLSGAALLPVGATALTPTFVEITNPSDDAALYLATITGTLSAVEVQNTGVRDLVYNKADGDLYTYVTFPDPSNPTASFYGQMLKIDPATGILSAVAAPVILPFANAGNEVAGTLLDKNGNFLILFTNGDIYKATSAGIGIYTSAITLLNGATGFPAVLRGDLASCGAGPEGGPLPVVLSDFNAYKQNTGVVLSWKTAIENNLNKFILQTSTNGLAWTNFSEVIPKGAANGAVYQFVDNNNFSNPVYYRLAVVDMDGNITYSRVKKISSNNFAFDFSIYPNPVRDIVTIESGHAFTAKANVILIDALGKTYRISSKKIAENKLSLNLSNFDKGVYYIHVTNESGTIASERIIKL